jgi:hypothetical protein
MVIGLSSTSDSSGAFAAGGESSKVRILFATLATAKRRVADVTSMTLTFVLT